MALVIINQATAYTYWHYNDVTMSAMASQITNLTIVYSTICLGTDQRKHQSSVSLAFARGIHRRPMNSPHKGPVTRKMFPFDDVIMEAVKVISSDHIIVSQGTIPIVNNKRQIII